MHKVSPNLENKCLHKWITIEENSSNYMQVGNEKGKSRKSNDDAFT